MAKGFDLERCLLKVLRHVSMAPTASITDSSYDSSV